MDEKKNDLYICVVTKAVKTSLLFRWKMTSQSLITFIVTCKQLINSLFNL